MNIDTGFGEVATLIDDGINKIWPDKTKEQAAQFDMLKAQLNASVALKQAQMQINLAAEQQKGWLTKGRDGAIWVCVFGFVWGYVLLPMLDFAFAAMGHPVQFPVLNAAPMSDLLDGLLGLGTLHAANQAAPHVASIFKTGAK